MSIYEQLKQTVTTRQAAERYGLPANRSGMARCPFHEDHNPSMKVDDRFYCFGCHATGDVIDFTARFFGLSLKDAAKKLAADFGGKPRPPTKVNIPKHDAEPPRDRERLCICVLRDYLRHLRIWQLRYRPEEPGDPIHPRFAEAMKALPTVNHLLDCLLGNDLLLAKETAEVLCREGYIQRLLYAICQMWCEDNGYRPIAQRSVSSYLKSHLEDYNLEASNKITNKSGKQVNGFWGIQALTAPIIL